MMIGLTIAKGLLIVAVAGCAFVVFRQEMKRRKNSETEKQEKKRQDMEETLRNQLREQLARLEKLKQLQPYSNLFYRLAQPLQLLLGLSNVQIEEDKDNAWLTTNIAQQLLQFDISASVTMALNKAQAKWEHGQISVPLEEVEPLWRTYYEAWDAEKLQKKLQEAKCEYEEKRVLLERKQLMEDLGSVCAALENLAAQEQYDETAVRMLAKQTRCVLEKHGIYPMYYEELPEELAVRFVTVTDVQLVYPGLYRKEDDRLVQLAYFSGSKRK